jgi:hypothetical protein
MAHYAIAEFVTTFLIGAVSYAILVLPLIFAIRNKKNRSSAYDNSMKMLSAVLLSISFLLTNYIVEQLYPTNGINSSVALWIFTIICVHMYVLIRIDY